ncbi:hypothetical protein [Aestuariivirga sp.]|uniref:hypothetical protein n=1 Tax=Aestuariivirga sp. TaxID=2650926 RepID=UPI0039E34B28
MKARVQWLDGRRFRGGVRIGPRGGDGWRALQAGAILVCGQWKCCCLTCNCSPPGSTLYIVREKVTACDITLEAEA